MKFIVCKECQDVVRLVIGERSCQCGKSKGSYENQLNAWYSGPCVPIGFDNRSLNVAMQKQPAITERINKDR
jgi:hypothetical protein